MTSPDRAGPTRDEASLDEVIAEYLRAAQEGRKPDRAGFLARFPHFAGEIASFIANYDALERAVSPIREIRVRSAEEAHASKPIRPAASPRDFGGFELVRLLGSGGMGVVYEARQRSMDRSVALKMIHGDAWASGADVQRFRVEVESIARLSHPNIVPIYEVGERQGHHYYSMPLMGGGSLAGRLDRLKGDQKAAARMLIEIAGVVDHAHRRGIIHRDLKPSNILLDDAGRPFVADFGLARKIGEDSSLTRPDAILGSPSYMSPEQTSARPKDLTTATDVYGLGAILYATLTGRSPFPGDSPVDILERVRQREPDRPRSIDRRINTELETICLKCLEKEPGRRYPGAAALAEDLGRWLEGRPILARRTGPAWRFVKWSRRHSVVALLTTVLAIGAPSAFAITYAAYRSSERARADLDASLYQTKIALAERELSGGHADRAEELLEECPVPLRGWEWNYLKRRRLGDPVFLSTPNDVPWYVAFSPNGRRLATGHASGVVRILDARTGREIHRIETGVAEACYVAFSPDGRRLEGVSSKGRFRVWDAESGRGLWDHSGRVGYWSLGYSPDGRQLATAGFDRMVRLFEAETGREVQALSGHSDRVTGVSFRKDGRELASSSDDGSIRIWDPESGTSLRRIAEGGRVSVHGLFMRLG